jgi:hypothetical protein
VFLFYEFPFIQSIKDWLLDVSSGIEEVSERGSDQVDHYFAKVNSSWLGGGVAFFFYRRSSKVSDEVKDEDEDGMTDLLKQIRVPRE